MKGTDFALSRRLVFGLAVLAAATAVLAQVIEGPPGGGYGWGSVVVSCLLVAIPLVAVGLLVLGGAPRLALTAIVVSGLMVVVVLLALFGNWAEQSSTARVLDTVVALLVVSLGAGTLLLEVPLLRRPRV